jgi:signal transduction histidine kinase
MQPAMTDRSQLPMETYRAAFARWLAVGDDLLAREELLLEVSELGKALVRQQASTDELMSLHHQTQALVAEGLRDARPGTPGMAMLHRLASGDPLALMLALLLPSQLAAQQRAAQAEEGLRQNDKLRAVATLAAGVAHDFNNLLGSIIGLAELCALQAPPDSVQARNLGGILQASRHAAGLVGQLLSFAREQPLQRKPVRLGALLAASEPLLAASLRSGQMLQLQLLQDSLVEVDAAQIEQVLLNLVKNAGQAQRSDGAVVRLLADLAPAAERIDGRPTARLRVIDHGPGIAVDVLPRVFERGGQPRIGRRGAPRAAAAPAAPAARPRAHARTCPGARPGMACLLQPLARASASSTLTRLPAPRASSGSECSCQQLLRVEDHQHAAVAHQRGAGKAGQAGQHAFQRLEDDVAGAVELVDQQAHRLAAMRTTSTAMFAVGCCACASLVQRQQVVQRAAAARCGRAAPWCAPA